MIKFFSLEYALFCFYKKRKGTLNEWQEQKQGCEWIRKTFGER